MRKSWVALILLLGLCGVVGGCGKPASIPAGQGERIVSLAPSLTEIVYAVGGGSNMVGRTSYCNYPPEAASVAVVGGFGMPSLEKLLALQATLVLEVDLEDASIGRKIDQLGLCHKRINCSNLDDIPSAIRDVGALIKCQDKAGQLAASIAGEIEQLRKESAAATNRPKVFVEIWGDPLTTVGRKSFVSDLIKMAGGINIGDEAESAYYQVAAEWVVARNPDIILCFYMSSSTSVRDGVLARAGWDGVSAIRNKRVYDNFNNDLFLRPGPRVVEGVRQLQKCIAGSGDAKEKRF